MAAKRFILSTKFSYQKMLDLPAEEARQYFILNFFVPVAYEMISGADEKAFVILLLAGGGDGEARPWAPVFEMINGDVRHYASQGNPVPAAAPYQSDQTYVRHYERICGEPLDYALQSRAMTHAFAGTVARRKAFARYDTECGVLASLDGFAGSLGPRRFKLSVVTKLAGRTGTGFESNTLLDDRAACRAAARGISAKFASRVYNRLTGEWIGLCNPADPNCCPTCKEIFASPEADNVYASRLA